jgi:hypothetical protein
MLTTLFSISLWALTLIVPQAEPADTCRAEDGDNPLSQKRIENWTLLSAKCSCFIGLTGSENSEFSIVTVKGSAGQKHMRLSAILSVGADFSENIGQLPLSINERQIDADISPLAGTSTIELKGRTDWITQISEAETIKIGQYVFTSRQSRQAMDELKSCYAALKGK